MLISICSAKTIVGALNKLIIAPRGDYCLFGSCSGKETKRKRDKETKNKARINKIFKCSKKKIIIIDIGYIVKYDVKIDKNNFLSC